MFFQQFAFASSSSCAYKMKAIKVFKETGNFSNSCRHFRRSFPNFIFLPHVLIIMKRLEQIMKEDNKRLKTKCRILENKLVLLETPADALYQHERKNNLVLSDISDCRWWIWKHSYINVSWCSCRRVISSDIEDCLWIRKPHKVISKKKRKSIIGFSNRVNSKEKRF